MRHTAVVVLAFILVIGMAVLHLRLGVLYYGTHSRIVDHAYYAFHNARLYERTKEAGRWSVAIQEWRENGRHPLRTVPLVLAAPRLLVHPFGHMATVLPALGVFLVFLGRWVYRRTGCLPYAAGCMALFCALPGFFSNRIGLTVYWLDLPTIFLAGAAAIALLNSEGGRSLGWLATFAALAACAALTRWVAAGYLLVMFGPVVGSTLVERWRRERSFLRGVMWPLLLIVAIGGLLAGPFLLLHVRENLAFYATYGYALGRGILAVIRTSLNTPADFIGRPIGLLLAGLALGGIILRRRTGAGWSEAGRLAWMAGGHLFLTVVVLQVQDDPLTVLYAFPSLFLLLVAPVRWRDGGNRIKGTLSAAVLVLSLVVTVHEARKAYHRARVATPREADQKALDVALAGEIARLDGPVVWNAFFDEYTWVPSMEAVYRFGVLPLPAGQDFFFSIHESVFRGNYPGLQPEQVADHVYRNVCRWVHVAVVLDDPTRITSCFNNPYSRAVARRLAETVRVDARWRPVFEVASRRYGVLRGYRNASPEPEAYRQILWGRARVTPD